MVELRLGLRAKLRLSVIICAVLDLLPTKNEINRQHRRRFADIGTISKRSRYIEISIFLLTISIRYDMANIGPIYRLDLRH